MLLLLSIFLLALPAQVHGIQLSRSDHGHAQGREGGRSLKNVWGC